MFGNFHDPSFSFDSASRMRLCAKLQRGLTALVVAYFRHPLRSSSGIVEELAIDLGLDHRDLALVHIEIGRKPVVLAAIPSRLWHDGDAMALLRELKSRCHVQGENLVLVPERFVLRQPRLDNAVLMAGSRSTAMPTSDRMMVLGHLIEHGSATLMELAAQIRHPDPVTALLGMVSAGLIDMNLDRPILPTSLVSMGYHP
jgi:hypothetical protein